MNSGQTVESEPSVATALNADKTADVVAVNRSIERQRVVDYLDRNPAAKFVNLERIVGTSETGTESAVQLGRRRYLVSEMSDGGVFVVSRIKGHYAIVSNLGTSIDEASRCAAFGGAEPVPTVGALPRTASGEYRFYTVTSSCQFAGYEHGFYLGIYRWHNGKAVQALGGSVELNSNNEADDGILHLRKNIGHFRILGSYRSFFEGGGGQDIDWRIYVGPNGIRDLGKRAHDTVLDQIDKLFDRIVHKKSASDLATAKVIVQLAASIADLPRPRSRHETILGELDGWDVKHDRYGATACLSTSVGYVDSITYKLPMPKRRTYEFFVADRKGSPYVSGANVLDPNTKCPLQTAAE